MENQNQIPILNEIISPQDFVRKRMMYEQTRITDYCNQKDKINMYITLGKINAYISVLEVYKTISVENGKYMRKVHTEQCGLEYKYDDGNSYRKYDNDTDKNDMCERTTGESAPDNLDNENELDEPVANKKIEILSKDDRYKKVYDIIVKLSNHEDEKVKFDNGNEMVVRRGQTAISLRKLKLECGFEAWTYLKELSQSGYIAMKNVPKINRNIYTVINADRPYEGLVEI